MRLFSAPKGKINQNEVNYAKRTQFPKKSNVYNRNFNNGLQRKIRIGHLVKTNPNKANFGLFNFPIFLYNSAAWQFDTLWRACFMRKWNLSSAVLSACLIASLLLTGCVERQLTINTEPQGA